jgi:hypothetical protein
MGNETIRNNGGFMTAEIIDMWLHRKGVRTHTPEELGLIGKRLTQRCMYKPRIENTLIDHNCQCDGCREFFGSMQRSSQEIMRDLMPLRMTGAEDNAKRDILIAELRANSEPINW